MTGLGFLLLLLVAALHLGVEVYLAFENLAGCFLFFVLRLTVISFDLLQLGAEFEHLCELLAAEVGPVLLGMACLFENKLFERCVVLERISQDA